MKVLNLATLYDKTEMDWEAIAQRLADGFPQAPGDGGPDRHTSWLVTINPDASPHATAVGAIWDDGALWFETGDGTRKARNIARDPRCTVSIALREFDLVIDGRAEKMLDPATVARMSSRWASEGWPCRVDETGIALTADYSAQSAGPPPWYVYRIEPGRVTAIETVDPGRATRWTF